MTDGPDGYVSQIGYAFAYHAELNPLRARLALLNAGWAAPEVTDACELGYGQGLAVNIHAAASQVRWRGTDALPAHAAFARSLAEISGAEAKLDGQTFEDFCARDDLPDFDFVGLHGVWSWVSEANARIVVDFLRRRLKPGGVVYVSYNSLPGAAAMAPLRRLLISHADTTAGGDLGAGIDAAFDFAGQILASTPRYGARPKAMARVAELRARGHSYLAHEYFNRDWRPVDVAALGEALAPAGLRYACPAGLLDHIDALHLTPAQRELVQGIADPMLRETARDFMLNREFRRDYWVKGAVPLAPDARDAALRDQRLALTRPRAEVSLSVSGGLGAAALGGALYDPILDVLADGGPRSMGDIEQALAGTGIGLGHIAQAAMMLAGKGDLAPAQDEATMAAAKPATDRLNRALLQRALEDGEVTTLASPVTGGGVAVDRTEQLFLLARAEGADAAAFAGRVLDGDLTGRAEAFERARLPMLAALGVV